MKNKQQKQITNNGCEMMKVFHYSLISEKSYVC